MFLMQKAAWYSLVSSGRLLVGLLLTKPGSLSLLLMVRVDMATFLSCLITLQSSELVTYLFPKLAALKTDHIVDLGRPCPDLLEFVLVSLNRPEFCQWWCDGYLTSLPPHAD